MALNNNDFSRMDSKTFKHFIPSNIEEAKLYEAYKKVKRIKGFYIHALVFIVINIMSLIMKFQDLDAGENLFQFKNFSTIIFWGLGLIAHGLSVFLPNFILGNDWEDKKIKELMNNHKNNKWK